MNKLVLTKKRNLAGYISTIYILNCIDLMFTYTYLKTGDFYEVNPLMRKIINNPHLDTWIKIIIPGLLMCYLCLNAHQLESKRYKYYYIAIIFLLVLYSLIVLLHLYYLFGFLF